MEVGLFVGDGRHAQSQGVRGDQFVLHVFLAFFVGSTQRLIDACCLTLKRGGWNVFEQAVQ